MNTPIVLLHGIRLSGTCWTEQKRLLSDRHVVSPDLPGHGRRRGEKFTTEGAVDAVLEAVDALGAPAVIVGHSLGGYVAIRFATLHPDRAGALVGVGCTTEPGPALRAPFRLAGRALAALPDGGEALSARTFRRVLPTDVAESVIAGGIASEVIPDVMKAAGDFDPVADLAAYAGPGTLINGGHDHFRSGERRFLTAARDGALQVVPGAGHYLPLTHGQTFANALDRIR